MSLASELFHIGAAILSDTIDSVTGTVLSQLGSITEEYVYSDSAETYQDIGFASRAAKVNKGNKAAECVAIKGDRDIIIARRDVRGQQIYGNLKEGETCVFGGGIDGLAMGRVLMKQDGSVVLYTTDTNTEAGHAVYLKLSPDGLHFVAPWGTLTFDANGFHMITAAGPRIDLGGLSLSTLGLPDSILSAVTSYANISAGTISLKGNIINCGNGPTYQPAVCAAAVPGPPTQMTLMTGGANQGCSVRISTP
jgi:hypothetical protein